MLGRVGLIWVGKGRVGLMLVGEGRVNVGGGYRWMN